SSHNSRVQRGRRRRERTRELEDNPARVADEVQLAVRIDAKRTDVSESARASEFVRVLDQSCRARFGGGGIDGQRDGPHPSAGEVRKKVASHVIGTQAGAAIDVAAGDG